MGLQFRKQQLAKAADAAGKKLKLPPQQRSLQKQADQQAFLAAFLRHKTVTAALTEANVTRDQYMHWRRDDKVFLHAFDDVNDAITDWLEGIAYQRAKISDQILIFLLRSRKPEVYTERAYGPIEVRFNVPRPSRGSIQAAGTAVVVPQLPG